MPGKTVGELMEEMRIKAGAKEYHAPVDTLSANVHKSISRYEDDNVGVQTAHQTELGAETAYHIADHAVYSHKLKAYDKAEKLVSKSDKANVNALFEKFKKDNPNASDQLRTWQCNCIF